jgi:hypothetical protein
MSGRIPPCSSIGPRLVAVAAPREDEVDFGLTTGPTPAGLEYAEGEAMLSGGQRRVDVGSFART